MKFTESLTLRDVETVAKGRISRAEAKNTNYATIAMVLAMGIGLIVLRSSQIGGVVLFILGAGVFLWYTSVLSKKQKAEQYRTVAEWHKEVQDKREQEALAR